MDKEIMNTTGGALFEGDLKKIYSTICDALQCKKENIYDLRPLQKGITNAVLSFYCFGRKYVYRYPGNGADVLVDRGREAMIQQQASEIGVDDSLVSMSMRDGWRIGKFVENYTYDYHNISHVVRGIGLIKQLHTAAAKIRWEFDPKEKWEAIKTTIPNDKYGDNYTDYPNFASIQERIYKLYDLTANDGTAKCIVHGDCRDENFLINDDEIYLIDWEYAGYGDPGFDIGTYIAGGNHSEEDVNRVLFIYFGRKPTLAEKRHFYAWIAISGFFYMHWCMFKEAKGQKVGRLKQLWYQYANEYSKLALNLFNQGGHK